jgi:hypothetical protein
MNAVPLRRVVHRPGGADTESSVGLDLSFPAQNSQKAHDDSHQCQGDDEFDRRSGSYPYQSLTKLDRRFHEYTFRPLRLTCSTFDDLGNESRLGGPIVRRRCGVDPEPRRSEVSEAPADTGQPPPPNPPPRVRGISPPTMRRGVVTGAESLARFYTEDAMDLPAGTKRSEPIPVCVLREHDLVIAPNDADVQIHAIYNWSMTNNRGTGRHPVSDYNRPIRLTPRQCGSYIIPKGAGRWTCTTPCLSRSA